MLAICSYWWSGSADKRSCITERKNHWGYCVLWQSVTSTILDVHSAAFYGSLSAIGIRSWLGSRYYKNNKKKRNPSIQLMISWASLRTIELYQRTGLRSCQLLAWGEAELLIFEGACWRKKIQCFERYWLRMYDYREIAGASKSELEAWGRQLQSVVEESGGAHLYVGSDRPPTTKESDQRSWKLDMPNVLGALQLSLKPRGPMQ